VILFSEKINYWLKKMYKKENYKMARHKLKEEEKKKKITINVDIELDELMNEYLEENETLRSRYIEKLIKEDMEKRGIDVKPNFEKK